MEEFQLVAYNKILSYKYKIITLTDCFSAVTDLYLNENLSENK